MQTPRVAVVGAKGYIGRNTVEKLSKSNFDVFPIDSKLEAELLSPEFWIENNFTSVVWSASRINPMTAVTNSTEAQIEIDYFSKACEALSKTDSRMIFISSGGTVYTGNELPFTETSPAIGYNEYGKHKVILENQLQASQVNYTILRLANAYGADQVAKNGQGVIAAWLSQILHNQPISIFGRTDLIRDFIHISDVTSSIESVVKKQLSNEVFNIGSGIGTSLAELIDVVKSVTGVQVAVSKSESRSFDRPEVWLDISKANSLLSWKPLISLSDGVSSTWQDMNLRATK